MFFMNKKEEVIDIELTPYGKRLLSMGKMKPTYYAFFDDNIMYDAAYAGIEESQNIIQDRITELTPQLQTQYKFTSKGKEGIAVDFGNGETVSTIAPLEKDALSRPLGTSRASGENYPAINIRMLSGNIKDYDLDYTTDFGLKNIPQVNIDISYDISSRSFSDKEFIKGASPMDDTAAIDTSGPNNGLGTITTDLAPDGSFISIEPETLLLDIVEQNTDFEIENFEIEVFQVGATLIPLSFAKNKKSAVVNGILLDTISTEDEVLTTLSADNVEYYFDIFVDSNIDREVINNSVSVLKSKGLYTDKDYINEDSVLIKEVISDIYGTNVTITDIKDC
tara:strand:+ start:51054 stop:52061 length:1008 start_codon:yes stop_codon:yes gene_type:complete